MRKYKRGEHPNSKRALKKNYIKPGEIRNHGGSSKKQRELQRLTQLSTKTRELLDELDFNIKLSLISNLKDQLITNNLLERIIIHQVKSGDLRAFKELLTMIFGKDTIDGDLSL